MNAYPQPGDFFVSRSNSGSLLKRVLPALVRWITASKWNHAGIYIGQRDDATNEHGWVIEAQPGGVRYWPAQDYFGDDTLWSNGKFIKVPNLAEVGRRRESIVVAAERLIGTKYGLLDCIALGFAQEKLGSRADVRKALAEQPWWVRRLMSNDTLICSQLVDVAYQEAGVHLFNDGRLPDWVSPGDLGKLLGA